jgi:ADP-ribose pyrophosphatase
VATGLRACLVDPDEEEEIELVRMPVERAISQVLDGEISDAKTIAGLLAYTRQRGNAPTR